MPYKDLQRKKEWERLHRPQRLARRQELRHIEAAQQASRPEVSGVNPNGAGFLSPVIAGGALAAYSPPLGGVVGGLILAIAAIYRKSWRWWILGSVILTLAALFYWDKQNGVESRCEKIKNK